MSKPMPEVSPALFFNTISAYTRTQALKAAIELDLFTAIAEGKTTAPELAQRCDAAERGVRVLCDNLVIIGFLTKEDGRYGLTPDTAFFLDRRSPAYVGGMTEFMLAPMMSEAFRDLTATVRKGGTIMPDEGTVTNDHPVWVKFARAMIPMTLMPSQMIVQMINIEAGRKAKVLDIAAGHGMYGIAFARQYPNVEVTALDWPNVLEVAKENARAAGVMERYHTIEGSAFEADFGTGYDLVLLTNFLHHFNTQTNEKLLKKVHAALADGGRAVTLEFIPNEDRITPPESAAFSLTMLASTPSGDAYTFKEFQSMFDNAGFSRNELHQLPPPAIQQVVISYK